MDQSIMTKIRNASKDWNVLNLIIKHIIKIIEFQYKENQQHKNGDNKKFIARPNLCFNEYKQ